MASGWAFVMSPCGSCRQRMSYNPHKVPSYRFDGIHREPVCRSCMQRINDRRLQNGLEPFVIDPQAYEPIREEEL